MLRPSAQRAGQLDSNLSSQPRREDGERLGAQVELLERQLQAERRDLREDVPNLAADLGAQRGAELRPQLCERHVQPQGVGLPGLAAPLHVIFILQFQNTVQLMTAGLMSMSLLIEWHPGVTTLVGRTVVGSS